MPVREPQFVVIADGDSYPLNQGWINTSIIPGDGATVTIVAGETTGVFTSAIVLGGSSENSFNDIWGPLTISSAGGATNIIINGNASL